MSADKYPSIFSRQMEAIVYIGDICLISISNPVSDGATNKSLLNIERA